MLEEVVWSITTGRGIKSDSTQDELEYYGYRPPVTNFLENTCISTE